MAASAFSLKALRAAITHPEHGIKTTHFWGPVANWGIVGATVIDVTTQGPEVISLPMTGSLCIYSALFMGFAWRVQPRNYLLLSCHAFNECVQLYQLRRGYNYQQKLKESGKPATERFSPVGFGTVVAAGLGCAAFGGNIQKATLKLPLGSLPFGSRIQGFIKHPAGPFTIHFWAPTWKWMLSVSNILDLNRPVDKVSTVQQTALCATGLIWTRYSFAIKPVNYNLAAVNAILATTGTYHLVRKFTASASRPKTSML